jgi:hypothetical protein
MTFEAVGTFPLAATLARPHLAATPGAANDPGFLYFYSRFFLIVNFCSVN